MSKQRQSYIIHKECFLAENNKLSYSKQIARQLHTQYVEAVCTL